VPKVTPKVWSRVDSGPAGQHLVELAAVERRDVPAGGVSASKFCVRFSPSVRIHHWAVASLKRTVPEATHCRSRTSACPSILRSLVALLVVAEQVLVAAYSSVRDACVCVPYPRRNK
jgi:hypothetical protein